MIQHLQHVERVNWPNKKAKTEKGHASNYRVHDGS